MLLTLKPSSRACFLTNVLAVLPTAAILQPKRMEITRHDTGAVYLLLRERGDRTKLSVLRGLFFGMHTLIVATPGQSLVWNV